MNEYYMHDIRVIRVMDRESGKRAAKWYIHDLGAKKDIKGVFDTEQEAVKASIKMGRKKPL